MWKTSEVPEICGRLEKARAEFCLAALKGIEGNDRKGCIRLPCVCHSTTLCWSHYSIYPGTMNLALRYAHSLIYVYSLYSEMQPEKAELYSGIVDTGLQ